MLARRGAGSSRTAKHGWPSRTVEGVFTEVRHMVGPTLGVVFIHLAVIPLRILPTDARFWRCYPQGPQGPGSTSGAQPPEAVLGGARRKTSQIRSAAGSSLPLTAPDIRRFIDETSSLIALSTCLTAAAALAVDAFRQVKNPW